MDKDFVLKYLDVEHLRDNQELLEIAEISGIEVVKTLLKNHESMRVLYIPTLKRNKDLMMTVIRENMHKYSVSQLARLTGLTRKRVLEFIKMIEGEKQ